VNPIERLDENLVASPRRLSGAPALPTTGLPPVPKKRFRFSMQGLGIAGIGIFAFLLFMLLKFPSSLVTGYALGALRDAMPAYNVYVKDASWGILLGPKVSLDGLEISPRYGQGPKISLDSVTLRPNIFRMIPWKGVVEPAASFSVKAFSGELSGAFKQGAGTDLDLAAQTVELGKIGFLQEKVALEGRLESMQFSAVNDGRWSHTNGTFNLTGRSLRLDPASLNLGMALPLLDLGNLNASAKIQNGKVMIERLNLGEVGKDLEAQVFGIVNLKDPVQYSDLDLQIKFRFSDKILKVMPSLEGMLGVFAAKRADGFYGVRVKGPMMMPGMPTPWAE
jgi:type II secretion system protein N